MCRLTMGGGFAWPIAASIISVTDKYPFFLRIQIPPMIWNEYIFFSLPYIFNIWLLQLLNCQKKDF